MVKEIFEIIKFILDIMVILFFISDIIIQIKNRKDLEKLVKHITENK